MNHLTTKWAPIIMNQNTTHAMTVQNLSGLMIGSGSGLKIGSLTLPSFSGA
jgi:hypothetical protein